MRRLFPVLVALSLPLAVSAQAPEQAPQTTAPQPAPVRPARTLTLTEAVRTALAQQPQLRQSRAGSEAADARADEARAPLLPQLTGQAQYQRTTANFVPRPGAVPSSIAGGGTTASGGTNLTKSFNFFSVGATLSQLIYDFGQTSGRWRAAQASSESQKDTEKFTTVQTVLGARTAFFNARAAKDLVQVARDNLANQDAHLKQTEAFVNIGTRPAIDLALARTNRANAEVQLVNAENGYETTKSQLNQAMGVEGPTDYDVADETLPPVDVEDLTVDPLLAEALRQRPDVAALDEQIRAQQLTLRSVQGAYAPSLGVSAGVTDAGTSIDSTVANWSATVTLSWNIFQGGLTRAQEREARANIEAARAQGDALRQQVRVDVDQARLAVRAGRGALAAAGEALTNAREQMRLAAGRYQAGAGSAIELGDAQVALANAAAQRVQAEYNLSISRAQLLRALGRDVTST
jgi:outer membrane protein